MQRHLDCGKYERALERETLTDRAIKAYAERLEGQTPSVPEVVANTRPEHTRVTSINLSMGWAPKGRCRAKEIYSQSEGLSHCQV